MTAMRAPGFAIGDHRVGPGCPVFVIAEIGTNHNGDFDRAIELIDRAAETGADCAKFQMRHLGSLYRERSLAGEDDDLAVEYTLDLLRRFELSKEQHAALARHCGERGLVYLCTPWERESLAALEAIGVAAYKVASADLTNLPLIEAMAATGKPLILSTGMSETAEIEATRDFLAERGADFALLHCNSTYPAAFANINLRFMRRLEALHPIIGYSGHERGTAVTLAAVALGARIVERHFTLDRGMEGPDHAASLEFADFRNLVEGIRQIEQALGPDSGERRLNQGELINRENLGKSLVAARPLKAGQVVAAEDVAVKSPGKGLSPQAYAQLIGRRLGRDLDREDFFYKSDLSDGPTAARAYSFRRPWGIPVRYHDFAEFLGLCRPDFVEFHLSYKDMDLDPADFLDGPYDIGLAVHAPELFAGSHLMDLTTPDDDYRAFSLAQTQRVLDLTRALKPFFPATARPVVVANVGGFSMDQTISPEEKTARYARLSESLKELDREGVELIPQTMAPFPWHFGGQRHQNIFIEPNEIADYCAAERLRICLDVSHSKLAANHFGWDYDALLRTLGPHCAHLHLGDAAGVDGEGIQVGTGEIDFAAMAAALYETAPGIGFIPEIWQGHKDGGEGFWLALERLEQWF